MLILYQPYLLTLMEIAKHTFLMLLEFFHYRISLPLAFLDNLLHAGLEYQCLIFRKP